MDILDAAPRLTLILLILYAGDYWYLAVPMTVVCAAGLLFRALYRSPAFWFLLSGVMAWGYFLNWYAIDNHKYLMFYWCLAIYFSLGMTDRERSLAVNARLLIGLTFAFATLWKLISVDYLSGDFFRYTLLADERFGGLAHLVGGTSEQQLAANRLMIGELLRFDSVLDGVPLLGGTRTTLLSVVLTWGTITMEGLIAVAFLAPVTALGRLRDLLLQLFALGTYAVAHVVGFGWLLMIMGYAQCRAESYRTRAAYVAIFFLIQLYTLPWLDLAVGRM